MSETTPSSGDDYKNAKANAKAAKAYAKAQRPWYKKKRFIFPLAIVALIAFGAVTSGGADKTDTTPAAVADTSSDDTSTSAEDTSDKSSAPAEKKQKVLAVTAKQILKEFDDNEAAADAKYDGKVIAVTGVVDKIDTEVFNEDEYVVQIADGGDFVFPTVNCDDQTNKVAAKIKKGQTVTATGDFEDGGDLGVEMHGCVLS
jgi:hypothetical protein